MGVAGHEHGAVAFALGLQCGEEGAHGLRHLAELVAREELEVDEHLVVARAAAVDFLAHGAEPARKHEFDLRVHVFDAVFYDEASLKGFGVDAAQFAQEHGQFVVGNEADAVEHGDVGHGAEYVVGGEQEVELAVVAYCEAIYLVGHAHGLLPEFGAAEAAVTVAVVSHIII